MKKVTLYVGCNYDTTQKWSLGEVETVIQEVLENYGFDYTTVYASGAYNKVREESVIATIFTKESSIPSLRGAAKHIAGVLKQECVGFEVQEVEFELVER